MKTRVLLVLLVIAGLALLVASLIRPAPKAAYDNRPNNAASETSNPALGSQANPRTTATSRQQPAQGTGAPDAKGNWAGEPLPPGSNLQAQLEELSRRRGVPLNVLTQEAIAQFSNVLQEISQKVNRRIEFYGKAVDETGAALAGARADFSGQGYPEGYWTTNLLTGSDGTFALTGPTGALLLIHVAMNGYEEVPGTNQNQFMYYSPLPGGGFKPDQSSPVVFRLHKKE
jgi:hypothetical protein